MTRYREGERVLFAEWDRDEGLVGKNAHGLCGDVATSGGGELRRTWGRGTTSWQFPPCCRSPRQNHTTPQRARVLVGLRRPPAVVEENFRAGKETRQILRPLPRLID